MPAICIDARHAKAALDMAANKTDANDADGLAHLAEVGSYREVRVKAFDSMLIRTLVTARRQLLKMWLQMSNQIHGLMKTFGLLVPKGAGSVFERNVRTLLQDDEKLARIILPMLHAWSSIRLRIAELSKQLVAMASEGIDVAIRFGTLTGQPGLVATPLGSFPWVLVATPRYVEAMGVPETPADLGRHHQIGYRDPASGQLVAWQFAGPDGGAPSRLTPRHRLVVEDVGAAWQMMRQGLGLAWLPAWAGLADLRDGRAIELLRERRIAEGAIQAVRLARQQTPPGPDSPGRAYRGLPTVARLTWSGFPELDRSGRCGHTAKIRRPTKTRQWT